MNTRSKLETPLFFYVVFGALVCAGLALVALVAPSNGTPLFYVNVGLLLGTMFGQTMLASAWAALGPLSFLRRVAASLAWLMAIGVATACNGVRTGPPGTLLLLESCLLGLWIVAQVLLWGLKLLYGVYVRKPGGEPEGRPLLQFGIRQVMIVTAAIAVILAAGRLAMPFLVAHATAPGSGEAPIFAFLTLAGILMMLPLGLAALLPRFALPATLIVLSLIGVATFWELPLANSIRASGPEFWDFVSINAVQASWIVAGCGLLRWRGYRLARCKLR